MKNENSRIAILFTGILSLLCIVAISIAIYVSLILVNRQNQLVRSTSATGKPSTQMEGRLPGLNRGKEQTLYFNGEKVTGAGSLLIDKKIWLFPLDTLLDKAGISYSYFNSDDILETAVNGNNATIQLWRKSFFIDDSEILLSEAPVAVNGHIMVTGEVLKYFDGFKTHTDEGKSLAFINYFPEYEKASQIKLLRTDNGKVTISSADGNKLYWESKDEISGNEEFYPYGNGKSYVLKSGEKMSVIKSGENITSSTISAKLAATPSADGKLLYWRDKDKKTSYIYTLASGRTKSIGDYAFRIPSGEAGTVYDHLFEFTEGKNYTRVVLTDAAYEKKYAFILRQGRVVVEGAVNFSPNMHKILFYREGKGYYASNTDGTGIAALGDALEAEWIDNHRIFLRAEEGAYTIESDGEDRMEEEAIYRRVGQDIDGNAFYMKNNTLYCEEDGTERKIGELPWKCEYVYALSSEGPYLAVTDDEQDGVFYLDGTTAVKAGKKSLLLRNILQGRTTPDYVRSMLASPERDRLVLVQRENGYLLLRVFGSGESLYQDIFLNCPVPEEGKIDTVTVKWISKNQFAAHTDKQGWVIDISGEKAKIYQWTEKEGSTIKGILF